MSEHEYLKNLMTKSVERCNLLRHLREMCASYNLLQVVVHKDIRLFVLLIAIYVGTFIVITLRNKT